VWLLNIKYINKFEKFKAEKDGLAVKNEIENFALKQLFIDV